MKKIFSFFVLTLISASAIAQSYAIGHVTVTYTDPSRSNRAIQTEIYYPAATAGESVPVAAGAFPVITFGHGFVMVWSAYQNVWESFVPEGYIVAFPRTEGSVSPVHADFGEDLAFLIGAIQQDGASNTSSLFYSHVGPTSAVMGHSMGGGSAFLAAEANTAITTMVTFAAANTNPSSIAAAQNISIPALVISGQNDCVAPPAQHQVPMYDSLASSCKAYVEILGGGHCYFAESNFNCSFGEGTCTPNPSISRAEQQDAAQDFALLWLDYYLKNNCSAMNKFSDSIVASSRISGSSTCLQNTPVISLNGNFLQSTPAVTYQWLLNGVAISTANGQTHTPALAGWYSVVVTYSNSACQDTSNSINWIPAGFQQEQQSTNLKCYPIPADDVLTVEMTDFTSLQMQVVITDIAGRIVDANPVVADGSSWNLNTENLPDGNYLLLIVGSEEQIISRQIFSVAHNY